MESSAINNNYYLWGGDEVVLSYRGGDDVENSMKMVRIVNCH